jgi:hypothetical protein
MLLNCHPHESSAELCWRSSKSIKCQSHAAAVDNASLNGNCS